MNDFHFIILRMFVYTCIVIFYLTLDMFHKSFRYINYNYCQYWVSVPEKCKLFDCIVASVLNYGCEFWVNNHGKYIETVHTKFCIDMYLIGVKKSTNLCAMYSDLGRFPLYVYEC